MGQRPIMIKGKSVVPLTRSIPSTFEIYTDEVKRQCTCKSCHELLVKGDRRLVIAYRPAFETTAKKGGQVFVVKDFYHMSCFIQELDPQKVGEEYPRYPQSRCLDCRSVLPQRVHHAKKNRSTNWGYLCESCHREPRWRFCRYCSMYVPRYSASPVLEESIPAGHFACDFCADERPVYTIKNRKRLNNMSESERQMWWQCHASNLKGHF